MSALDIHEELLQDPNYVYLQIELGGHPYTGNCTLYIGYCKSYMGSSVNKYYVLMKKTDGGFTTTNILDIMKYLDVCYKYFHRVDKFRVICQSDVFLLTGKFAPHRPQFDKYNFYIPELNKEYKRKLVEALLSIQKY